MREAAAAYERAAFGGQLRLSASIQTEDFGVDISEHVTFPEESSSTVREFEDERNSELGAHFESRLDSGQQLELLAIHRAASESGGEREVEVDGVTLFRQNSDASESIIRSVL